MSESKEIAQRKIVSIAQLLVAASTTLGPPVVIVPQEFTYDFKTVNFTPDIMVVKQIIYTKVAAAGTQAGTYSIYSELINDHIGFFQLPTNIIPNTVFPMKKSPEGL